MADNAKVTFKVELDDSALRGQLNGVVSQLSSMSKSKKVTVAADASAAKTAIKSVESDLSALGGKSVKPVIDADTAPADAATAKVDNDLDALSGKTATPTVDADTSPEDAAKAKVENDLDGLSGKTATPTVDADTTPAEQKINAIKQALEAIGIGSIAGSISGKIASGSSFMGGVWNTGMAYETSRAKASTLMESGVDAAAYDDRIMGLAAQYGQGAAGYNEAVYNMLSAGQNLEKITESGGLLDLASQMSIGGFTDVNTAAGMLAKMGNAFGSTDYNQMAQNALIAQKYGITDVGQLAATMPMVNSSAANAGVSQENLMAAMAAITNKGVMTNVAGTMMNQLINELDKTGMTGQKTLAAAYGDQDATISKLMAEGQTLADIARTIAVYGEANGLSYADMFSSQEAGKAIANILGQDSGGVFDAAFADMALAAKGELDEVGAAYEKMADTTAQKMAQITTSMDNAKTKIFAALAPSIEKLLNVLTSEKAEQTMSHLLDRVTEILSSDKIESFIDAVADGAEYILDLVDSGKSLGEILIQTLADAAKAAFAAIVSMLPDWLQTFLGLNDKIEHDENYDPAPNVDPKNAPKDSPFGRDPYSPNAVSVSPELSWASGAGRRTGAGRQEDTAGKKADKSLESAAESSENMAASADTAAAGLEAASGSAETLASGADAVSDKLGNAASKASSMVGQASTLGSRLASLASAISRAISRCASIGAGGGGGGTTAQKSVGMSYVPYDGYTAMLHKGEMVLTAAQASTYRSGVNGIASNGIDYDALSHAMSGMSMTMDGKTVGKILERSISSAQGARYVREQRGLR